MHYSFRATRSDAHLGLWTDDCVIVDTEHPDEITICRHQSAEVMLEGLTDGILEGVLEDESPERPAAQAAALVRLVSGLAGPPPPSYPSYLHLVREMP